MGFADFFKGAGSGLFSGAASLIGGGISAITGKSARDKEYERQKEFAQHGLRWKVADAKAAGIHPLYALGANTASYSPQAANGYDLGLSEMGQNISRAIEAKQTPEERELADLQRENAELNNQLLRSQIKRTDAETGKINSDNLWSELDYVTRQARLSEAAVNTSSTQRPPAMPHTDYDPYEKGDIIRQVSLIEDPYGRLVSLTNSQNYHDVNEDVPIVEALPFLEALTWDARAKITQEPIKVGRKWYAHNGSEYVELKDPKAYKSRWKKWFFEKRVPKFKNSSSKRGGIAGYYGAS